MAGDAVGSSQDAELLALFEQNPKHAWEVFIDRYSDGMLSYLKRRGLDHDEAMDRFVYVCEKLCADDCRRFSKIRHLDKKGTIMSWLVRSIDNLCIDYLRSKQGRKRLFRSVEKLGKMDQLVLDFYFQRQSLPGIYELLVLKHGYRIDFNDVLASLDRIFRALPSNRLWKLANNLRSGQGFVSYDEGAEDEQGQALPTQIADSRQNPEDLSRLQRIEGAFTRILADFSSDEKLILRLRFDQGLSYQEIADILQLPSTTQVGATLKLLLTKLKERLQLAGITYQEVFELGAQKLFSVEKGKPKKGRKG